MPSLNVTFSDEEMERVRSAAQRRGQALKPYAHDAILAPRHRGLPVCH
jgi:hypothetical protein